MKRLAHFAILSLAACGSSDPLEPPGDVTLAFQVDATGVQKYRCDNGAWKFVEPSAGLFATGGSRVGTHGAGPTWHHTDGSGITAKKIAEQSKDPTAIPWLLLEVTDHDGPHGAFSDIVAVQRIDTVQGVAPVEKCTPGAKYSATYSARYVFWRKRARD